MSGNGSGVSGLLKSRKTNDANRMSLKPRDKRDTKMTNGNENHKHENGRMTNTRMNMTEK